METVRMFAQRMLVCGVAIVGLSSGAAYGTSYGPIFLKFTGINGDSVQLDHKNWTEVQSVSWGISRTVSTAAGGGGSVRVSTPTVQDVQWNQQVDRSVPQLLLAMVDPKPIATATVDFTATCTSPSRSCTYFEMSFRDVLLTSLNVGGSSGEVAAANGAFAYAEVSMTYWGINADGGLGKPVSASYEIQSGKGSTSALASVFALGSLGPGTVVPEPSTALLALTGLLGLAATRHRRVSA